MPPRLSTGPASPIGRRVFSADEIAAAKAELSARYAKYTEPCPIVTDTLARDWLAFSSSCDAREAGDRAFKAQHQHREAA